MARSSVTFAVWLIRLGPFNATCMPLLLAAIPPLCKYMFLKYVYVSPRASPGVWPEPLKGCRAGRQGCRISALSRLTGSRALSDRMAAGTPHRAARSPRRSDAGRQLPGCRVRVSRLPPWESRIRRLDRAARPARLELELRLPLRQARASGDHATTCLDPPANTPSPRPCASDKTEGDPIRFLGSRGDTSPDLPRNALRTAAQT